MSVVAERLGAAGLLPGEARRKRELFETVDEALRGLSGRPAGSAARWFVPGRIEVLGKHTDYAGGRSLLCAVGRGFCVAAAPRPDAVLRIADAGRGLAAEVPLDAGLDPSGSGWTVYARTVAARAARNFPGLSGADVAFASDLPRASGLSSSSALVVALFTALAEVNDLAARAEWTGSIRSREDLGGYLGGLENGRSFGALDGDRGVGTFGGSEDQTAILCCRAGEIAQYAFCPVRHERSLPLESDWSFIVASSGVAADKTGSAKDRYNRLSLAAAAIVGLWNRSTGKSDATLFDAVANGPDVPDRLRGLLRAVPVEGFDADFLVGRLDQFLEEALVLIPRAGDLLAAGEAGLLGEPVDRSQMLAETFLGNQVPETIALARSARALGAAAASAFGGGFGGSVWALVRSAEAEAFRRRWAERFAESFPAAAQESRFFVTRPGPSVVRL
ncbi:MAG TPA: galactokinase family protein [Thermoanaerobaculia bacterium]|nr:galactokinase family protein [Thermoanaerobaculia bacterium]